MRSFRRLTPGLALAAVLLAPQALAQTCDYQLLSATWGPHPHPDSIYVNFAVDVIGPVSNNPANPSQYSMDVAIRFNNVPLEPNHELMLLWWQRDNDCAEPCPNVVCIQKEWMYKTVIFRDSQRCTRNAQGVCGCPPLGTPVVHNKPVKKPPGPGIIDVEIIPLSLHSCTPINPQNDRRSFFYPGEGGGAGVPGLDVAGAMLLATGLGLLAFAAIRRRTTGRTA